MADGPLALVMAYQSLPDLILCDLDMPGFDGLQLCRAIRDDIVLGQVPFVLMSDEEERLQRAHELGASADAFLRKESSGEHILKRLLDLSVPLRRVTERLSQSGRVRGRLSGISAYGVIEQVCRYRPTCSHDVH